METTKTVEPVKLNYKDCKYIHIYENFLEWESEGDYEHEVENELLNTVDIVNGCYHHESMIIKRHITKIDKSFDSNKEEGMFSVMIYIGNYANSFSTNDTIEAETLYAYLRDWLK